MWHTGSADISLPVLETSNETSKVCSDTCSSLIPDPQDEGQVWEHHFKASSFWGQLLYSDITGILLKPPGSISVWGLESTHEVDAKEMEERYPCGLISVTVSDKRPHKLWQWVKLPKELLYPRILFSFQLRTHRQNPSHFPSWIWWYHLKSGQKYLSCISTSLQWSPTQEVAEHVGWPVSGHQFTHPACACWLSNLWNLGLVLRSRGCLYVLIAFQTAAVYTRLPPSWDQGCGEGVSFLSGSLCWLPVVRHIETSGLGVPSSFNARQRLTYWFRDWACKVRIQEPLGWVVYQLDTN